MTKEERCPVPLDEQLRHLSSDDVRMVKILFSTYLIAMPPDRLAKNGGIKRTRLSENDIQAIRFLDISRIPKPTIADLMDCSICTVQQILNATTWRHLPYNPPEIVGESGNVESAENGESGNVQSGSL